jgi:hypothetical protein
VDVETTAPVAVTAKEKTMRLKSAAANRALSANDPLAVAASTATLLYTPGFIVIPGSWVDEAKVTSRKLGETSIVALRCANCLRELGLQESLKENALRLFDHAIVATLPGHPALPWSAADTVADLMLSALVDSQPTKAPKIVLTGPTSALTVWVLDQVRQTRHLFRHVYLLYECLVCKFLHFAEFGRFWWPL